MDVVTLGAALNGSAEYVNSHFKGGSNIQIVDNPDGTQTINASGEVSSEDTVARAEIAAIKDGETLDSFGDVETALDDKADTLTTYTKTEIDTALSAKANSADVYSKTAVDTALGNKADKSTTYTKTEVDTSLGNKADKPTTYTKTEVDTALGNKVDKVSGKGLSTNDYTTAEKTKLAGIAEGAEVNEIEGIKVNGSTVNPDNNKVVSITIPTSAADVSALPDTTKYAVALSLTINSSTYVMTGQLKDQNGDNLGTAQTIDLPLESVVVNGSYDSQTKKVVLTLQNGNTIEFSVADLVSGLQTELSESNKLNPTYINYDSTHRAVSDTEKSTWNGKQNAIDSSHKLSADLVDDTNATNKFATAEELEQIQTNKNNISYIAKNNVINTFIRQTGSYTNNGVTFTTNADGSVTLANTATGGAAVLTLSSTLNATDDTYILYGDGFIDGVYMDTYETGWTNQRTFNSWIDTVPNTKIWRIVVSNGTNADGVTIRPMMCKKSLFDSSYHQYAMSNEQITAWIIAHS